MAKSSCCLCKYKVRRFYSKGAFLILVWFFLVSLSASSVLFTFSNLERLSIYKVPSWMYFIPGLVAVLALILSGLLADRRFGNYKVARFGLVVSFIGTLSISICVCLDLELKNLYIATIFFPIVSTLTVLGLASFLITSLQLGLDQMPDASSANITSFVAWFVFSLFAGIWISNILYDIQWHCINYGLKDSNVVQIWSIFPSLCVGISLLLNFLFVEKLLILEPKSQQSLQIIYKVLKFAAKHKAPLNRSALTYWEDEMPSRLDLGKLKYGGPFTTEQVEDVKTILKLLAVSLPILVIAVTHCLRSYTSVSNFTVPNNITTCGWNLLTEFSSSSTGLVTVCIVIYEFAIYPVIRNRLPSILRRIGIFSFLAFILNIVFLTLECIHHFYSNEHETIWITNIVYSVSTGLLSPLFLCAVFELVPAQAPYNMRGLFSGYITLLISFSVTLGDSITSYFNNFCDGISCNKNLILVAIKLALSLFGFILYCLLARWYKRRVRDDIFSPHRVVEEVYDRYLTAEHTDVLNCASS